MTEQQRLDLISVYPEMFGGSGKIEFNIEPGWFEIFKEAVIRIKDHDDSLNSLILQAGYVEDKRVTRILQIKENSGSIRLHISEPSNALSGIISNLERESSRTCQNCGSKNNIGSFSYTWTKTLCSGCAKKKYLDMERRNALRNNTDFEDIFIKRR
jgi:hypothetical protein